MKNYLLLLLIPVCLFACTPTAPTDSVLVENSDQLNEAIAKATPGSEIVLADGVWNDLAISFYGEGTEQQPITLRAETPGNVFLEGQSYLDLAGEYLIVSGLYFRNGYSPTKTVIRYRMSEDSIANHCQVTSCVIEGFTRPNRFERDRWIELYGKHNKLDHCYISGKANDGVTLMVYHKGNEHTKSYHQIVNNYFGPRPRKGGPRAETIRLGGSETSMTPGYVNVSDNYFEACNGEVEIISDKTNFNSFTGNIFYKCEGSLVMRHSDYTTVDGNMFIGDDDSDFYGGIRAINTGHWITNNYFYKIRGEEFRSPLAVMNGIPKSSLNRYKQVTDVVVAHNTWVDCKSPWQIGVGQNKASADVLPVSEIRSAPPIRTTIANNLIYNTAADEAPVVNHDDIDGVRFENNVIDNAGSDFTDFDAVANADIEMNQVNDWLYVPTGGSNALLDEVFPGYGFDMIESDLFGASRGADNKVGAISDFTAAEGYAIDKSLYGPDWFSPDKEQPEPAILSASAAELATVIEQAKDGDIVELTEEVYTISESLVVNKEITIRSSSSAMVALTFTGSADAPAFELNPNAVLRLENVSLSGQGNQGAFAPLSENMSSPYRLFVTDCTIENFGSVLVATKGSFADSLSLTGTTIRNCKEGFILAAEEKGDYNAEMVTFDDCTFENIGQNVLHFYRGGYDESTIGGFLTISDCQFSGCGSDNSGVLLKTRGIINVFLTDNSFTNNAVRQVAVLWGAKNNHHSGNTVSRSGEIVVEEQQKLELLY